MKTTLSIMAAACLSGAAYGQDYEQFNRDLHEQMERHAEQMRAFQAQEEAQRVHEQLEEIQAAQRRSEYCPLPDQLQILEERRLERQRENYLRQYLEDYE